ncbi:YicC/YloC family endoribonuclease [Scleromatobacter humisilvae]|uniref:YicC family protein n=1 Tax=Scleromatobacter humisilvae TaxID=2897159 RepID=A0A9X1YN55_9BURK|nr:YicC/YloC family endoribonuclease [Scleromatobacter humisilvae]MCK9689339.1 YicC family protein [Scleromatobacter humisilvae]
MAVYSMTGFGNASATAASAASSEGATATDSAAVTVELRSVNSRFLDISFRMPDELRQHEGALRDLITAGCRRGKVDVRVSAAKSSGDDWPQPTADQLNRLSRLEGTVTSWMGKAQPLTVNEVLQWCRSAPAATGGRVDEALMEAGKRAVAALREARAREGEKLVGILMERIVRLRELAAQAEPLVPAVVERQQQRFLERWAEALKATGGLDATSSAGSVPTEALRERAMNEAATFALRIDVAEELSRLRAHLEEIARLLKGGGELGKRLDFLIQELHREANTLGSKSAALELTGVSVEMKVLIEQMREQVQNVE